MGPASVFRAEYKTPNNITNITQLYIHNYITQYTLRWRPAAGRAENREEMVTGLQENIATWALGQGVW